MDGRIICCGIIFLKLQTQVQQVLANIRVDNVDVVVSEICVMIG